MKRKTHTEIEFEHITLVVKDNKCFFTGNNFGETTNLDTDDAQEIVRVISNWLKDNEEKN